MVLSFYSCGIDMQFTMQRTENLTAVLKMDGYYYFSVTSQEVNYIKTWFLYKNGNLLNCGDVREPVNLSDVDLYISEAYANMDEVNKRYLQPKYVWGVYKLEDNDIKIERYETPIYPRPYTTIIENGKILNDTTFVILDRFFHETNTGYVVQDTFRFREFALKPDSTNRFIK